MRDHDTPERSQWWSVRHVAAALGVTPVFVYRLIERDRLVATTTELGKLVNPASVEVYRAQRPSARKGRGRALALEVTGR